MIGALPEPFQKEPPCLNAAHCAGCLKSRLYQMKHAHLHRMFHPISSSAPVGRPRRSLELAPACRIDSITSSRFPQLSLAGHRLQVRASLHYTCFGEDWRGRRILTCREFNPPQSTPISFEPLPTEQPLTDHASKASPHGKLWV